MGNLARSFGSRFVIPRDKIPQSLAAAEAVAMGARSDISSDGAHLERLQRIFRNSGWDLIVDAEGNVVETRFVGDALDGILEFKAVAPFVDAGSYVDFWQEYADGPDDGPNTRWAFENGAMSWQDPMPPEKRRALQELARMADNIEEINAERRRQGQPVLCGACLDESVDPAEMVPITWPSDPPTAERVECPRDGYTMLLPREVPPPEPAVVGAAPSQPSLLRRLLDRVSGRSEP